MKKFKIVTSYLMNYKKPMVFGIFLFFATSIFIYSCSKEKTPDEIIGKPRKQFIGTPLTQQDLDKQFRWIAKGLAQYSHRNFSFRSLTDSYLKSSVSWERKMQDISSEVTTNLARNYPVELEAKIDAKYIGNDYDPNYLFGFSSSLGTHTMFVYMPHADNIDTTKRHYFIPILDPTKDTLTAYYLNGAGVVDSIQMDEMRSDTCYIWIIDSYPPDIPLGINSFCNENGSCELELGEEYGECADCPDDVTNSKQTLILKDIQLLTDHKFHHENWAGGPYEIGYAVITADATTHQKIDASEMSRFSTEWKGHRPNAEVERCRGSVCRGTNVNPKTFNHVLSKIWDPSQAIYIIFYEWDWTLPNSIGNHTKTVPWIVGTNTLKYHNKYDEPFGSLNSVNATRFPVNHVFKILASDFVAGEYTYTGGSGGQDELSFTLKLIP